MTVHYTDEFGNARVDGGHHLKSSQAYPRQRGSEVHHFDMTYMQGRRPNPYNDVFPIKVRHCIIVLADPVREPHQAASLGRSA